MPTGGASPNPLSAKLVAALVAFTLLVGAVLFALPPTAEPPPPRQVWAAAVALVVWSYCDGFFGRLHWGLAALEGLLLLKLALNWTALLLEAFGTG